jgi:hypothetical protein
MQTTATLGSGYFHFETARSKSFVKRQDWTVSTGNDAPLHTPINGFSRKMENHAAATALNYFAYNFIKIHRTLRTSPAMAAGRHGSAVERRRFIHPLGVLRAAEGGKSSVKTERAILRPDQKNAR